MIDKKQKNIPEGWEFKSVGELLDYEQPTNYIVKSTNYNNKYKTPVLTAGKTFLLGYTDEIDGVYNNLPVIIFDDFTTAKKYVDFPFKVKSSAMKILKEKPDIVNLKFIYGWMQIHPFKVGEHKRNYLSEYQYQTVLLPPLPEQIAIVKIIETWDKYLEKLSRKIEIKKNIKKGLMQRLLTGAVRLSGFSGEWESVKLGDVFDNVGGTSLEEFTGKNFDYKFISIGNYSKDGRYIDNGQRIKLNEKTKTKLLKKDNLVMVLNDKTHIGDIIGSSILIDEDDKYIYNQRSERLICKNDITPLFAWYYLNFRKFRKKVFALSQGGTQIYVNFPNVKKLKIELPNKEEQNAIAKILTTADKEIEILEKKKKIIEDQKKYLLNNLVTGKIRIPEFVK